MAVKDELKDFLKWYQVITPAVRALIMLLTFGTVLIVAHALPALVGPLVLFGFWTLVTLENRTLSLRSLLLAAVAGLFVLMPLSGLASAFLLWLINSFTAKVFLATMLENLCLLAVLIGLILWPRSRLRISASILDFAMLGLALGAGLEWGIGFLSAQGMVFMGPALGLWPQLPGMVGHVHQPFAATAPSTAGLLLGLLAGYTRYLSGPDLKLKSVKTLVAVGLALVVLLWIALERAAVMQSSLDSTAALIYRIDLNGRLLVYLTFSLAALTMVVEWLLVSSLPGMNDFTGTLSAYHQAWHQGSQTTVRTRLSNILLVARKRRIARQIALAEDIKPLLAPKDLTLAAERISRLQAISSGRSNQSEPSQNSQGH